MEAFMENIYNTWLKATGLANKRPYKPRKDFSDIKADDEAALYKLNRVFKNFTAVNMLEYFMASYVARENDFEKGKAFIPLSEFATPASMRRYLDACKNNERMSDRETMGRTIRGFSNIVERCKKNGWKLAQYIGDPGLDTIGRYQWVVDYAQHNITAYNIIAFDLIGFNTEAAIRNTIDDSEIPIYFDGSYEEAVTSKIDNMTDTEKEILKALLRRAKKSVDTAIEK